MTLHLIKLCVGINDSDHLAEVQDGRRYERAGRSVVPGFTKRMPTRVPELLDGGSLYWVIRGSVRVRQRLLDFETVREDDGETWCRLILDPELVATVPMAKRPFQGWRYLPADGAPADLRTAAAGQGDELPEHLVAELRRLGLA